jgi:Type II secretion system (T2SS), protein E, N-terminal domain
MSEHRPLLMRSNRLLGSALIEHSLVKFEDLEAANERLLEIAATGDMRRSSVLSILVFEKKVLREEDLLHHVVDDHGVGVIDLRGYEVPEEVKKDLEIDACWATWSVPFDKEEDFNFVATAYYLSPAARAFWEKKLGGQIIWQATTMDIIAEFLDRVVAERTEASKRRSGTRPPFPMPTGSTAPFPRPASSSPVGPTGDSTPPMPLRTGSTPPIPPGASVPPMPS